MKQGLDWYKREPRAFLDGVQGLGPEQIGAFAVLLDLIYARGGDTLRDDRHLAGVLGCSVRKARALTDQLIQAKKIIQTGEILTNKRAEKDAKQRRNERETLANRGRMGGEKSGETRKNKELDEAIREEKEKSNPPTPLEGDDDSEKSDEESGPGRGGDDGPDQGASGKPKSLCQARQAFEAWNAVAEAHGLAVAKDFTDARKKALRKRVDQAGSIEAFRDVLSTIPKSPFLMGDNERGWKASIKFICQESSFANLREGTYHGGKLPTPAATRTPEQIQAIRERAERAKAYEETMR